MIMYAARQHKESACRTIEVGDKRNTAHKTQSFNIINKTLQRKTSINFRTSTLTVGGVSCMVGTYMSAVLDPKDVVRGSLSTEDTVQTELMRQIYHIDHDPQKEGDDVYANSKNKYVKGHLLNHDLGGPGLCFNLFPITNYANSQHKNKVEMPVKKLLSDTLNEDKGECIKYDVEVNYSCLTNGLPKAEFKCTVNNENTVISSSPDDNKEAKGIGIETSQETLTPWNHTHKVDRTALGKVVTINGEPATKEYLNQIAPPHTKDWNKDEEKLLLEKQRELGNKWNVISSFFLNHTANDIKKRYDKLKKMRLLL